MKHHPAPDSGHGVLAPQSGGCARHVLSQRVTYAWAEDGHLYLELDTAISSYPLLAQSTVTLICEDTPERGEEMQWTGRLEALDGGRHRLNIVRAYHVLATGEKVPLARAVE